MKKQLSLTAALLLPLLCGHAQMTVNLVPEGPSINPAADLASVLLGTGVTVESGSEYVTTPDPFLTYDEFDPTARGYGGYSLVGSSTPIPESGVILSTGDVRDAPGPNLNDGTTASLFTNDSMFQTWIDPGATEGTRLSFKFSLTDTSVTEKDLFFQFVFASEEFNEYVFGGFNDGFALVLSELDSAGNVVDAENIAREPYLNWQPVNVDSINYFWESVYGSGHYYDNDPGLDAGFPGYETPNIPVPYDDIEYDGFSSLITANTTIQTGTRYQIDFLIADVGDQTRDSAIFLMSGTFGDSAPVGNGDNVTGPIIPEPSTVGALGLFGLAGFLYLRRRRQK
jgi:hypothetical protein